MELINYNLLRTIGLILIGLGGICFLTMMLQAIIALGALFKNDSLAANTKPFVIWLFFFFCQVGALVALIIGGVASRREAVISVTYLVVVYIVAFLLSAMAFWLYVLLKDILEISIFKRLLGPGQKYFSFSLLAVILSMPFDFLFQLAPLPSMLGALIVTLAGGTIALALRFGRKLIFKAIAEDELKNKSSD